MQSTAVAQNAYAQAGRAEATPRRTEYQAFARITHRLVTAHAEGKPAFPKLAAAVAENRKLWTILAEDLALADNSLPEGLRAGLLSLAIFTTLHTDAVLAGRADAQALIDVNTAVMRGLRGEPPMGAHRSEAVDRVQGAAQGGVQGGAQGRAQGGAA
ncbi:MAG: flagellar biosynthesis regulator FlaF [Pseudomonadota bacterium]